MCLRTIALASALLGLAAPSTLATGDEGAEFFEKKVRPLLIERCYECHSEEKKIKGGLRLDSRQGWIDGGDSGPAVVPGHPEKSIFVEAIRYGNLDLQMPPKKKLPAEEVAIFEQWVKMGAPDPRNTVVVAKKQEGMTIEEGRKFWCYTPVRKPERPSVRNTAWPQNEIDRFILARMEATNVQPAPDASPAAIVRRLYFNLIGLPPTPAQIEAFEKAAAVSRQTAIESLVDELLASPHFGERWGRHWLDVARFAESSGGGRTLLFKDAWRYRDYVIDAFNADVPFDQFVREQIAGDLLPAAIPADRRRQLTATAFLVLGPTNYEEQDKQQLRFDIIDEQLDTIGKTLLGQTIGCARCHDHKFDPVSQRDYYAMAGILASTKTLMNYTDNVARWIALPLPGNEEQEKVLREHEAGIVALEGELKSVKAIVATAAKAIVEPVQAGGQSVAAQDLPGIVIDDTEAKVVGEWTTSRHVRSFIGQGYLHDNKSGKGEKTITFTPNVPETARYEVRLAYTYADSRASNVRVAILHADGEESIFVDQNQVPPIDGRFLSLGKYRFEKNGAGYVLISNAGTEGYVTVDALQLLPEESVNEPAKPDEGGDPKLTTARKRLKEIESELKKRRKEGPVREVTMAVCEDELISDTQIRVRGIEKQRGEKVPRGFLQVALNTSPGELPANESGRRELANWIANPGNPLTTRVFVNRVWSWLFGVGIVRTVDNFGTTGEAPSHPELLDYLASRFMVEGWSVKKLVREIVRSRTWQQAVMKPSSADPENRLFAHANRRRLDAEQIRDAILHVSGQLKLDFGGPNIAGAGEIDANSTAAQNIEYGYAFEDTRRSVYTPAFRNKRLELFDVFDFGDINQPIGQRHVSTVAPQALYLLNHPFVMEHARASAARTLAAAGDEEERISEAFLRTLGRLPMPAERVKCRHFVESEPHPSLEIWAQLYQTLFACLDFRYLE